MFPALPVDEDASFGEEQVPEVFVCALSEHGEHGVVDEQRAIGKPQRRENGHHHH